MLVLASVVTTIPVGQHIALSSIPLGLPLVSMDRVMVKELGVARVICSGHLETSGSARTRRGVSQSQSFHYTIKIDQLLPGDSAERPLYNHSRTSLFLFTYF